MAKMDVEDMKDKLMQPQELRCESVSASTPTGHLSDVKRKSRSGKRHSTPEKC